MPLPIELDARLRVRELPGAAVAGLLFRAEASPYLYLNPDGWLQDWEASTPVRDRLLAFLELLSAVIICSGEEADGPDRVPGSTGQISGV